MRIIIIHVVRLSGNATVAPERLASTARNVQEIMTHMSGGKSPGINGLSIDHIQHAGVHIFEVLAILFNLCIQNSYLPRELMRTVVVSIPKYKKNNLSCLSNYRPISLSTITGKFFERLLQLVLAKTMKIDDAQFGFHPGLSTDSAIFCPKHTVRYYTIRNTSVYACFLDLSRAFDLVNYNLLWSELRQSGTHVDLVNLLRFCYENQINNVRWGDSFSDHYKLECGVRQGGLTSSDLFNILVNDLIVELRITNIGCHLGNLCVNKISYADDMVLLSPSIKGLRNLLVVCECYAESHGLKYNGKKTEILVFRFGKGLSLCF
ncbi:hypothetical protein O3G_MSEX003217 [Manduca sexta]|uniref:Reverse transcriptase domain-containing protein n=1 Tax=Manduca sexta TaxID=7130 RepID=A0A922CG22_MANSE|nr:hypothetical protein O3G_MSEX003217 [Manduca sexta]